MRIALSSNHKHHLSPFNVSKIDLSLQVCFGIHHQQPPHSRYGCRAVRSEGEGVDGGNHNGGKGCEGCGTILSVVTIAVRVGVAIAIRSVVIVIIVIIIAFWSWSCLLYTSDAADDL